MDRQKLNDSPIRIAIVDDEALIVMLLSDYFSKHKHIVVSLTANDGSQFIELLRSSETLPDIVLLDLHMKELNGIDTTAILKKEFPDLKIIVISSYYKKTFMGYMLKLGVNSFLPKGIMPDELAEAIEVVFIKGYYFMAEQIDVMRNQISSKAPVPYFSTEEDLSEREIEVLKLICQQFTAQQIADRLYISPRTVEGHKSNLLLKTSARNIAGLVIYAVQRKIIDIDDCLIAQ